ncbi:cinnamoyl-CoA reductase 1 [Artemisia annua]|uniref:Cinnamoyl-CoA reductase 1 n=1 Tax=Artemisia annua TaxID=35608 RepID=A0A2U1LUS8_ARTAN|nr:cinnamoyl-CoA reductase 1 [Artemisia annua]
MWYPLSKTLAEKAPCDFAKEKGLDIVVVNPGTMMGPIIPPTLNATMLMTLHLIQGEPKFLTLGTSACHEGPGALMNLNALIDDFGMFDPLLFNHLRLTNMVYNNLLILGDCCLENDTNRPVEIEPGPNILVYVKKFNFRKHWLCEADVIELSSICLEAHSILSHKIGSKGLRVCLSSLTERNSKRQNVNMKTLRIRLDLVYDKRKTLKGKLAANQTSLSVRSQTLHSKTAQTSTKININSHYTRFKLKYSTSRIVDLRVMFMRLNMVL